MQPGTTAPTLIVPGDWETVLTGTARETLERSIIPQFLLAQRWFGGKARRVSAVRIADWTALPTHPSPAFLILIEVEFGDGATDLYALPLGISEGPAAQRILQSRQAHILAQVRGPQGEGILHDALADDDTCTALLAAIAAGREFNTHTGVVRASPTEAFAALAGQDPESLRVTLGPPTSSNSLVLYGARLLLKLFRRLEPGINPDFEIGRFLTEKTTFDRFPKTAGAIEYHRPNSEPVTLAVLQELVANQGSGWFHTLEELDGYFKRAAAHMQGAQPLEPDNRSWLELSDSNPSPVAVETIGTYWQAAATLGKRTAELHLALANPSKYDSAFTPEPWTAGDWSALTRSMQDQGRTALATLQGNLDRLPPRMTSQSRHVLKEAPQWLARFEDLPSPKAAVTKIRCHGDYHLGQVLWTENDFVILDFEGEPTRTVAERRAKQSPLKDVAGMLRSFHYAAYAGLFAFTQDRSEDFERLQPWADLWQKWTSAAFLKEYRATVADAPFLPAAPAQLLCLLELFVLDKAFYELVYELNNRPDWVPIPLQGILSHLGGSRLGS